jgi:hypothetical protein
MAAKTWGAFAAGVVVGWVGRSVLGSTRELVVRAVVLSHGVRERIRRVVAEQIEWVEDTFAEGRARHEAGRGEAHAEEPPATPTVADVSEKRGRAA